MWLQGSNPMRRLPRGRYNAPWGLGRFAPARTQLAFMFTWPLMLGLVATFYGLYVIKLYAMWFWAAGAVLVLPNIFWVAARKTPIGPDGRYVPGAFGSWLLLGFGVSTMWGIGLSTLAVPLAMAVIALKMQ